MDQHLQWVAYRDAPGAMLRAPLPSAPEVGLGWRGVATRRWLPLDQLDDLVLDTVAKLDAAIGLARSGQDWSYAIAASRGGQPVRLVLGVDLASPSETTEEILVRCGITGTGKRWSKVAARAVAAWSEHAPRVATAAELERVVSSPEHDASALEALLDLLGIDLPVEPIPDVHDLQSVARDRLVDGDAQKRRWFARR